VSTFVEGTRVALVTGAARGIGAAVARRLGSSGCAIVAFDRCQDDPALPYPLATRAELDRVVAECGDQAIAVEGDVRDQDSLDGAVARATREFGGLDVAVACAGVIAGGDPAWESIDDVWNVNIDVNLTGVWRTARAAVPAMLDRAEPRTGRFVAIASAAGAGGHPAIAAYTAAKHGVVGFVRSLAVELGPHGITANAVSPGSTSTEILEASREVYDLHSAGEFAVHHPIGRLLLPDEIASAVSWLCHEDQSGVTGIALAVDGGMTI
jgi:SDR family mycofactocin-dependent oxidoreductase